MMLQSAPAFPARAQAPDGARRLQERIKAEIAVELGFVPPFFAPVLEIPEILAALWQLMRSCYLRNPIPSLTKEKLFARLSRLCPVPYAIIAHSCSLRQLGMHSSEILDRLDRSAAAAEEDLAPYFSIFAAAPHALPSWPETDSPLEEALVECSIYAFLNPERSARCRSELLLLLGTAGYARLTEFLGYVRMHHIWLEAYPEPSHEKDDIIRANLQAMSQEEPRLAFFFANYYEAQRPSVPASKMVGALDWVQPLVPLIIEQVHFGIAVLDPDHRILKANKALCELLGYAETDLAALSLTAILHPEDAGNCTRLVEQVLGGARRRARTEQRFLKRTKEVLWVDLTASAVRKEDGSPLYVLVFVEDITERKQTEEAVRAQEQMLERLLLDNQDGIFAFDSGLVCTQWNPAMERIVGIKKEEAVGRVILDVLPFLGESGEDRHLLETLKGEIVTTRNRPFSVAGTGKEGFYDAHYTPLYDGGGKAGGGIAFIRDITERVKAESSQLATEERYLELFENANDIVFIHDLEGRITSVNKAAERITGYSRAEMLQMKACDFVPPEHLQTACKTLERQIAGEGSTPYELEIICKDGRRVALEVSNCIIMREGKPFGVQGIARDISERKKTEEALQQAKHNLEAWVRELEQRTREMTLLSEMGDMLRACLTTEEAYTVIVRVAQQIFPVQVGALYVISPARNLVEAVAVWGDASLIERVFAPDECWALRRGRVHWVEDSNVGLLCKHLSQPIPESYLCVPMMAQSEALGVLYLAQPAESRLTEAKQRLAVAMAEQIAMALSNLRLNETLRSQSLRDPLTGLFNRRFMEESLELELRRAARNRRPVGMIMLEVDNLQAVSQPAGADAENDILLELGNLLQGIVRKEDLPCRYSSEKFTVILPQGSLEVASQRAESLREMTEGREIHHRGIPVRHITISAGVACFPDHGRTVEALVRAADAALERAKQEGGDRVVTAQ